MKSWLTRAFERLGHVVRQDRLLRFLISRLLWRTGLGHRLGMKIHPVGLPPLPFYPTAIAATLWLEPNYCWEDLAVLDRLLRPGDTYVDVGANIGVLARYASDRVGSAGQVIALEPHPRTRKYLVESLRGASSSIEVHEVAAGEADGVSYLSDLRIDDQNRLVGPKEGSPVKMSPLDILLHHVEDVRLLKVDTEGAELAVLRGAESTLGRTHAVLFEGNTRNSSRYGTHPREVANLLIRAGFSIYDPTQNGLAVSPADIGDRSGNLLALR